MATYVPAKDGDLLAWLANFQAKIAVHGPVLGLTAAEVTALATACGTLSGFIIAVEAAKTGLANAVASKDASKSNDLLLIKEKIARMKTHEAYTAAIGEDLGIVSSPAGDDMSNKKPELNAQVYAGYVRVKFTKKGFTAVKIFSRLKGQPGWSFLAVDTFSPYDDQRPLTTANQPEEREYRAIGLLGDDEAGLESDIVTVIYGG